MRTAEVDESAFHRAELLNGIATSSAHAMAENTNHQNRTPLAEKSVSLSLCSGSASGSGGGGVSSVNTHKLVSESFNRPTKCLICASLLLGQQWQGLRCQQCGFVCHLQCRQAAASLSCNSSSTCSTPEMPSFVIIVPWFVNVITLYAMLLHSHAPFQICVFIDLLNWLFCEGDIRMDGDLTTLALCVRLRVYRRWGN
ncbi:unnamed protein product [Rodentolepis nana]|uniref:Phorbol-ester/DAG-type domain-containing protein n=1 Tax=Rodentolepis nana TaxID=102285 RepID=A0A0R3TBG4_RODNA|nr:unnamed protein product [Rodentolepis nana]